MRKRILYICSTVSRSGPTRHLYTLISHLDRNRYEPVILTLSPEPEHSLSCEFKAIGIPIHSLGLSRIGMMHQGRKRLREAFIQVKPDILHTHGIRADTYSKRFLGFPAHIATIHNYAYEDYPMNYGRIRGTQMARHHIDILKEIPYAVAVSQTIASKLERNHRLRAEIICNGIDIQLYKPVSKIEKMTLRSKLDLEEEKIIFVYTGVLIELKDPLTLVQAFNSARIGETALFIILGDGPLLQECRKHTSSRIKFFGQVANVVEYLQASDYFVSASTSEGLPMSVIEAMSCGLPVLLSDIGSHCEIAEKDHSACYLFETRSVNDLKRCFREVIGADAGQPGVNARQIIERYYSATTMVEQYQHLYDRILDTSIPNSAGLHVLHYV